MRFGTMMRRLAVVAVSSIALSTPASAQSVRANADAPTIVLFISDDLGVDDMGAYGATDIRTPNIDRLAREGMRFDRAYVASPTCGPSRAALLTAMWPQHNGVEPNHDATLNDGITSSLIPFRDAGYEVAAFGKVAHTASFRKRLWDRGFTTVGNLKSIDPAEIEAFLTKRDKSKPLLLLLGHADPHIPWPLTSSYEPTKLKLPPRWIDTPEARQARASYYADIKAMDDALGETRALLARHIDPRKTAFFFTSDHGASLPRGKWNLYERGIRTPLIASWPGRYKAGSTTDAIVSWVDLLPTFADMLGVKLRPDVDGKSFRAVLDGESRTHRDLVFASHTGAADNSYPIRAAVRAQFKYIRNLHPEFVQTNALTEGSGPGTFGYWQKWRLQALKDPAAAKIVRSEYVRPGEELYDLSVDPFELNNLAGSPAHAAALTQLRGDVDWYMADTGDRKLVFGEPILATDWTLATPPRRARGRAAAEEE